MIKTELFFHSQLGYARSLGFSARFTPAATLMDQEGHPVIQMALTQCNKNDKVFSKKIARQVLREREGQTVRVRDVPSLMAAAYLKAVHGGFHEVNDATINHISEGYNFLLRKFI